MAAHPMATQQVDIGEGASYNKYVVRLSKCQCLSSDQRAVRQTSEWTRQTRLTGATEAEDRVKQVDRGTLAPSSHQIAARPSPQPFATPRCQTYT